VLDLRDKLPRAAWTIGQRGSAPTGATLHYNGPPVAVVGDPAGEQRQLAADARYHMRPDTLRADGIQYHYAVLSDGTICQLRDETAVLWHCANGIGNNWHLAIHLPLGGTQAPAPAQWAATTDLFLQLIARYGWVGRGAIVGHREWPRLDGKPQKSCPGPIVFRQLLLWRGAHDLPRRYRASYDYTNVRQGPATSYRVAIAGDGTRIQLSRGAIVLVDSVIDGVPPSGSTDRRWAHLADQSGFVHASLLEAL